MIGRKGLKEVVVRRGITHTCLPGRALKEKCYGVLEGRQQEPPLIAPFRLLFLKLMFVAPLLSPLLAMPVHANFALALLQAWLSPWF